MERASSRLRVLALLVALMFIALSTRLWFLQVLATQGFDKEARQFRAIRLHGPAAWPDRTTHRDASSWSTGEPRGAHHAGQLGDKGEAVVGRVARSCQRPGRRHRVQSCRTSDILPSQAIPVAEFVPKEVSFYIAEHPSSFPASQVESTAVRSYPFGRLAAQVLG